MRCKIKRKKQYNVHAVKRQVLDTHHAIDFKSGLEFCEVIEKKLFDCSFTYLRLLKQL